MTTINRSFPTISAKKVRAPILFVPAALIALVMASTAQADCPDAPDPSIICARVTPPCTTNGIPNQIPGTSREGKELCSGNLLSQVTFPFGKGPIFELSYNSQIAKYHPSNPERTPRENEGFGAGWSGLSRIQDIRASGTLVVRNADGSLRSFIKEGGRWFSEHRQRADLSVIDRLQSSDRAYVLKESDGSQFEFNEKIGDFIYLTEVRNPSGLATKITYQNGFPSKITAPDGSFISFTCGTNGPFCDTIKDRDNVAYTLAYANGLLSGYLDPAGRSTIITYTNARVNPTETQVASITNSIGAKSFYAYYQDGVVRAVGDGELNTTFTYRPNEVISELNTTSSTKSFSRYQFSSSASGPFLTGILSGDGNWSQNPGVLQKQIVRLADGRPTSITNMFGESIRLFYGEFQGSSTRACNSSTNQTSSVPTCIVAASGEKTVFTFLDQTDGADPAFYQPKTITRFDKGDQVISNTELTWARLGLPSQIRTLKGSEVLASTSISYQKDGDVWLPKEAISSTTTSFTYHNQIFGRVASTISSSGDTSQRSYDAYGRVRQALDNGNPTTYSYSQTANGGQEVTISSFPITSVFRTDYRGLNQEGTVSSSAAVSPAPAAVTIRKTGTRNATSVSGVATTTIRRGSGTITITSDSTAGGSSNGATDSVSTYDFGAK